MSSSQSFTRIAILALCLDSAAYPAAAPDPVYKALREAALAEALVVENLVLQRDVASITLKTGSIAFTAPVMERETMAIFVGEGEISLTPATMSERAYLKGL